ncbi:MAG: TolC family protein, partial [Nitrospira sp.]|nr:TolC family protein [Nitrospira sp.]
MKKNLWVCMVAACALCWLPQGSVAGDDAAKPRTLPPIPLSLNEVLAWIDRSHPLLKGAGTEKVSARGKML